MISDSSSLKNLVFTNKRYIPIERVADNPPIIKLLPKSPSKPNVAARQMHANATNR